MDVHDAHEQEKGPHWLHIHEKVDMKCDVHGIGCHLYMWNHLIEIED